MREIKFRLRLKSKIDFGTMKEGEILTMVAPVFDIKNGLAYFPIDTKVWELLSSDEFTGLKDKHNNDIFEGDIVTCKTKKGFKDIQWTNKGVVEYVSSYFGINVGKIFTDDLEADQYTHFWNNESFEIIGNIHQHPELLK